MAAGCLDEIVSLDDLVDALGHLERFGAMIGVAAAQLNASGGWAADGSLSMAAWLRQHARLSHRDAARLLREGRFLDTFSAVGDAAVSGRLSSSQVNALRAAVSKPTGDLFGEHQQGVVDAVAGLDAAGTEQVCQSWRDKAEAVVEMPEPKVPERSWTTAPLEDGTVVGRFVFDKVAAEQMDAAIEAARCWDGPGDARSPATRNADAVLEIFGFFNANSDMKATPRHRPHVEFHVDATIGDLLDDLAGDGGHPVLDGCAVTSNGRMLPSWATDAFLCDCVIHRVMRSGAAVLDYGRTTRTVPPLLWKAVAARDRGCRAPGCTRKKAWCDAHHIRWWRKNGETKLDNLLLLCQRHHHLVHKFNWHIHLDTDTGEATFTLPDGRVLVSKPPGVPTIRAA